MKVLIISPHFPPTNAPDMQRVRMILPYLSESGMTAEVLAVNSAQVAAPGESRGPEIEHRRAIAPAREAATV